MANDQTATPSAQPAQPIEIKEEKPSDTQTTPEPTKEESQVQVTSPDIGQVEETNQTWPISPKLANQTSEENQDKTVSPADSISTDQRPVSSEMADDLSESTQSAQTEKLEEPTFAAQAQTDAPIQTEEKQVEPETTAEKLPETVSEKVDTDVELPDNQASQVQSGPSDNASSNQSEKPKENLANFKPEPPEASKTAKSEENISENSPQVSFGDINSGKIQPEKPAETHKPFSFGDLLKDQVEESKNNISDDLFEIHDEPQITNAPEEIKTSSQPLPQQSTPLDQTQISQSPPQPANPPEPKVIEKIIEKPVEKIVEVIKEVPVVKEVIKEIKVTDEEDVRKRVSDHILSEQQNRRILANQARSNKKSKHLEKVIELVRNTENISNEDIQRLLHVSQSTATNYLSELTRSGALKRQGIRGGSKNTL